VAPSPTVRSKAVYLALAVLPDGTRDIGIPFFAFPPEVRRVIYTTNALESVHAVPQDDQNTRPFSNRRGRHEIDLVGVARFTASTT
jgi:transposase-like protein